MRGSNPGEISGIGKHKGIAVIIVFSDGEEGRQAAEELAEEPGVGGKRRVSTSHDGRVVLSLANHSSAAEDALAERCSETQAPQ